MEELPTSAAATAGTSHNDIPVHDDENPSGQSTRSSDDDPVKDDSAHSCGMGVPVEHQEKQQHPPTVNEMLQDRAAREASKLQTNAILELTEDSAKDSNDPSMEAEEDPAAMKREAKEDYKKVADDKKASSAAAIPAMSTTCISEPPVNVQMSMETMDQAVARKASQSDMTSTSATAKTYPIAAAAGKEASPPPLQLQRQQHRAPNAYMPVGAVAVFPSSELELAPEDGNHHSSSSRSPFQAAEEGSSSNSSTDNSNSHDNNHHHPTDELLLNATLVPDNENNNSNDNNEAMEIVEAKPAPTGFRAIYANQRFKYLAAGFATLFVVVLVAIVVPVALLGKNNNNGSSSSGNNGDNSTRYSIETCGTRSINQADYRGNISITSSGTVCQRWDANEPHTHLYDNESFPSAGLDENYCRNPEGDAKAWCYTVNASTRWEWCDVPFCDDIVIPYKEDCGSVALGYSDYRGTINITATGKTCQRWDSLYPHTHGSHPSQKVGEGLENNNYCRDPLYWGYSWCYTTDNLTRNEPCNVPACERIDHRKHNLTCETNDQGKPCTVQDCGSESVQLSDYRGTINTTVTGRTCQRWDSQFPHAHTWTPEIITGEGLEENYCRNPDDSISPWCFTTDPNKRVDLCEIPYCTNPVVRRKCGTSATSQTDYRGDIKISETGTECLNWADSAEAKSLGLTHTERPWSGLVGAFCRNPNTDQFDRAGCFTGQANASSWEYCSVPDCSECGTITDQKVEYRGTESKTRNGTTCVYWRDKEEDLLAANLTTDYFELEENWCRNPDGLREDVWCYTSDAGDEWEFCSVPDCEEGAFGSFIDAPTISETCGALSVQQTNYRGPINVSATGQQCQPWSSQDPHVHKFTPEDLPLEGLDDNSCRNPDPDQSIAAWCFVNDSNVRWEYCNVPSCEVESFNYTCGSLAVQQKDYRGTEFNVTVSGIACQRWDSQSPHPHRFDPGVSVTAGLEGNFCRNPDKSERAWCFTMNKDVLWEYCAVPEC